MIEHSSAKLGFPHEAAEIQRSRDQRGPDLDLRNSDRVGCDDARDLGTIALDTTEPGCASPDPLVCRWRLGELRPLGPRHRL